MTVRGLTFTLLVAAALAAQPARAPIFSITTEQGRHISPDSFGGKLLVVNFWETACAPCVKELPSLSEFARRFRTEQVVAVAISGDDDPAKYRQFLRDHPVGLETYRDPARRIAKSFGTEIYPETYLIQGGRIVRKVEGPIDWTGDEVATFIRSRLALR
jgi:peroxiredoxin